MTDLNFSEPIVLAYNQRGSIVLDDVVIRKDKEDTRPPQIVNYGLIKNEDNSFTIKSRNVALNSSRDLSSIGSTEEAKVALSNTCATKRPKVIGEEGESKLFGFTVKSFPHYGAYGFVNYNEGEDSSYQYGIDLNNSRSGGGVFT